MIRRVAVVADELFALRIKGERRPNVHCIGHFCAFVNGHQFLELLENLRRLLFDALIESSAVGPSSVGVMRQHDRRSWQSCTTPMIDGQSVRVR